MTDIPFPIVSGIFSDEKTKSFLMENGFTLIDFYKGRVIISRRLHEFGFLAPELLSGENSTGVPDSDREALLSMIGRIHDGEIEQGEGQFRFSDGEGESHWIDIRIRAVDRGPEKTAQIVIMNDQDITELHHAQEEIRERLMEIDSLKELLFAINKSLDFDETLARIIEHLHRIIPFDRATVQSYDGDSLTIIGGYGYPNQLIKNLKFPVKGVDNPSTRAMALRRPIICNDVERDFAGFTQVDGKAPIKSWLGIPLVYEDRTIGLFSLDSYAWDFYRERHARIASNVAEHISIAVEHARQHSIVKEEARTDSLTGVANRYGLETIGQELFIRASRNDHPLGVLMIDIDFFKQVNDAKGHAYGDLVLIAIAEGIQQSLRINDYLVRYGGEEFLVLLPDTSARESLIVAERLRETIPNLKVNGGESCPTVSIGVFSGVPGLQELLHEFIRRADLALYDAKSAGRNRCRVWRPKFDSALNH